MHEKLRHAGYEVHHRAIPLCSVTGIVQDMDAYLYGRSGLDTPKELMSCIAGIDKFLFFIFAFSEEINVLNDDN